MDDPFKKKQQQTLAPFEANSIFSYSSKAKYKRIISKKIYLYFCYFSF